MVTQPRTQSSRAPRGVALINALLIVAALSAVTVALLQRTDASVSRSIELQRAGQTELYLDALTLQLRDVIGPAESAPGGETSIVERGQRWAQPATQVAIGDGIAAWNVDDLQGRFDLAWLTINLESPLSENDDGEEPELDFNAMVQDAFRQIALDRGVSRGQLRRLEQALIPSLAQRVTAYGRTTRPPPLPPSAVEELLLVDGIDDDVLDRLAPVIATLGQDGAGLNLNTVSAEVLAALLGESSGDGLSQRLTAERPFTTSEDALRWIEDRAGADRKALMEALGAGIDSTWFEARIELQLDTLVLARRVVLQRIRPDACCRIQSVLPEYP